MLKKSKHINLLTENFRKKSDLKSMPNPAAIRFIGKLVYVSEGEVEFHIFRFIKIFIYQTLFFLTSIIGGLIVILLEGYAFAENMMFVGCKSFFGPLDHMNSLMIISMMMMYLMFPTDVYEPAEFLFPVFTILTRSMVIAVRYSYMSNARYSVLKSRQTFDYLKLDLIILSWRNLKFEALEHEIRTSRTRLEYEEEDFRFSFMTPIDIDLYSKISNPFYYKENELTCKNAVKLKKIKIKEQKKLKVKPELRESAEYQSDDKMVPSLTNKLSNFNPSSGVIR